MSRLKFFREKQNLTQVAVSKMLGCTSSAINQYETGKRKPSFDILIKLSKIYGCSVDDFIDEEQPQENV